MRQEGSIGEILGFAEKISYGSPFPPVTVDDHAETLGKAVGCPLDKLALVTAMCYCHCCNPLVVNTVNS